MLKISGAPSFVKDASGGIVNIDTDGFNAFVAKKIERRNLESRINRLERSVEKILIILQELECRSK